MNPHGRLIAGQVLFQLSYFPMFRSLSNVAPHCCQGVYSSLRRAGRWESGTRTRIVSVQSGASCHIRPSPSIAFQGGGPELNQLHRSPIDRCAPVHYLPGSGPTLCSWLSSSKVDACCSIHQARMFPLRGTDLTPLGARLR